MQLTAREQAGFGEIQDKPACSRARLVARAFGKPLIDRVLDNANEVAEACCRVVFKNDYATLAPLNAGQQVLNVSCGWLRHRAKDVTW